MTEDVVAEVVCVVITHELGKTDLVVDDEEGLWLSVLDCILPFRWIVFVVLGEGDSQRCSCPVCSMLAREWKLREAGLL